MSIRKSCWPTRNWSPFSSEATVWDARTGQPLWETSVADTMEGYSLTARTAVEIAERVTAGKVAAGAQTPSLAFGAGFIEEFEGSKLVMR